jgi:acetyl esterase
MNPLAQRFARFGARLARRLLGLPPWLVRLLAGPKRKAARGLHPQALLLARLSALPRPGHPGGVEHLPDLRIRTEIEAGVFAGTALARVTAIDRSVPGPAGEIPVRLYVPPEAGEPSPLLVFFHGGGWAIGSLNSHDGVCRHLADEAGVRVLAVDYRLAPEHPFPAAFEDALAAYAFVAEHPEQFGADPARIAVGGDSAGGNLAAAVANEARSAAFQAPAFQLLIYPVVDQGMRQDSYRLFSKGYFLTLEEMNDFTDAYVPDHADRDDPRVAPLRANDLSGTAPAHVVTALADPLRDEGVEYFEKLRAAGVPATHEQFPLLHGFMNMRAASAARDAASRVAAALQAALAA